MNLIVLYGYLSLSLLDIGFPYRILGYAHHDADDPIAGYGFIFKGLLSVCRAVFLTTFPSPNRVINSKSWKRPRKVQCRCKPELKAVVA